MTSLKPTDKNLLFTKNDKEDPRLGECIEIFNSQNINDISKASFDFAILGYPDDEGIQLNGGRIGAKTAPQEIRTALYKMTPHLKSTVLPRILDLGDISTSNTLLADRHELGRSIINKLAQQSKPWLSFGGGHDYGYCDSTGFISQHCNNAVVINFDAHMDVRPTDKGLNSGTPFYRMLSEYSGKVDFAEVGIQNQCNSRFHIDWATQRGTTVITLDQINEKGLLPAIKEFMMGKESKKVFLSLDIDAMTSNEAPGCSQSWTTGLTTKDFLETLTWLQTHFDVCGLGIYEVSPALDQDKRTSKLAALIAHHFIFSHFQKG